MLMLLAQHEQNVGLFNEVKNLKEQLTPMANILDSLQSDSATIVDACQKWCELMNNEQLKLLQPKVQERFNQAMLHIS